MLHPMTLAEFQVWWCELQVALGLTDGRERAQAFSKLLGAQDFEEPVTGSWMMTFSAGLSGSADYDAPPAAVAATATTGGSTSHA